jgi:5-formyltetrahydrofolate cyclo-ligase
MPRALKVGLAFGFQVVGSIPSEEHDVAVDVIVTEEGIVAPERRRAERQPPCPGDERQA